MNKQFKIIHSFIGICAIMSLLLCLMVTPASAIRDMTVQEIINIAASGVGSPYVWGGSTWSTTNRSWGGADCSGYVGKCWQVARDSAITEVYHPYSTFHFYNYNYYWSSVSRSATVRADAMVYNDGSAGHIVLFDSGDPWGSLLTYEAKGTAYGIVHAWRTCSSAYVTKRRQQIITPVTWGATYVNQSYPTTMNAGDTAIVWVEYKNTGTGAWTHSNTFLGTSSPQDRSSPFYLSTNWTSPARPSDVDEWQVLNGEVGRFTFIIKAPATPGTYTEKYKLVQEGVAWFGSEVTWTITVKAATGNITGTVRNAVGNTPIAGATVAISGVASTTTNTSGVYTLTGLAPGAKTLTVSKAGFTTATGSVTVTAGSTVTKDFTMESTDKTPPTNPSGLTAVGASPSQINLSWTGSTDPGGAGLAGYIIYRGGSEVGRTASTTYSDNGLVQNTNYSYYVKAYDNANNVSGQSNTASASTKPGDVPIFEDGFVNANYWAPLQQSPMTKPNGLVLGNAQNHGTFTGSNSFKTVDSGDGNLGTLSGHTFSPAFAAAKYETWFYDTSASNNSRQGLQVRCLDGQGGLKAIFYVGTYPATPGTYGTYTVADYTTSGGWNFQGAVKTRSVGWHKFTIDVQPYTGAGNEVTFYIDGAKVGASVGRSLDTQTYGLSMVAYGFHYRVNQESYFDDCAMYAQSPLAPTMNAATALSSTSIRWNVKDNSNNEMGFKVLNAAQATVASATVSNGTGSIVAMTETDLAPNTAYTRSARAFNGSLDSQSSANATKWTLSTPPSATNVTCNQAKNTWYGTPTFTFTAVGGFGSGTVAKYLYAWDTSPTHTWTGSEAAWSSGDLILESEESGEYYLHVRGFNGENVANGTLDLGPYFYDGDPPDSPTVTDDGVYTGSTDRLNASWSIVDDNLSGVVKYWYAIGTTPGATNVVNWTQTTGTSVSKTGLSLNVGATYYFSVKAENAVGLQSGAGVSDGIKVVPIVASIPQAKMLPDGSVFALENNNVSANFGHQFYISDPKRVSGLRIEETSPAEGVVVSVAGKLITIGGERALVDVTVVVGSEAGVVAPLFMITRSLGGSDFGPHTFGVTGATGVNTIGLLVAVTGRVTHVDEEFCYIDDGSTLQDGSGFVGTKVDLTKTGETVLSQGQFIKCIGISAIEPADGGARIRLIRPRRDADVVVLQ